MRLGKSFFLIVILLSVGCSNPQPRPAINIKVKTDNISGINQNK